MRIALLAAAVLLLTSAPVHANTIVFNSATNNSSCGQSGSSGDRSCTNSASLNNGALDSTAAATLTAQASADHGITTNATAIADMTVSYSLPYTVTRTITGGPGPGIAGAAFVPIQTISFNVNTIVHLAHDNSQTGGGLANAIAFDGTVSSTSGLFGAQTISIAGTNGGGGGPTGTTTNVTDIGSYGTSINFSGGAAGEVAFAFEIPSDYRMWEDFLAPAAIDYNNPWQVTQSITDTLVVTFRLRAESRPEGSISTTGGEAIACAGQSSPLGSFDLDDGGRCNGTGVFINASVTQTGTQQVEVPEPTTLGLLGLAGLAIFGARRRRS